MRKPGEHELTRRSPCGGQPKRKPEPVAGRRVVDAKDAAALVRARGLPMSPSTLKRLRTKGGGPSYIRPRGRIHYPIDLLEAWVDEQVAVTTASTAEEPLVPAPVRRGGRMLG